MFKNLFYIASIALLPVFVNALSLSQTPIDSKAIKRFLNNFLSEAEDDKISAGLTKVLEIPPGTTSLPVKVKQAEPRDGYRRYCEVVLDPVSGKKLALILAVNRMLSAEQKENHFFKLSLDGKLQLVVFGRSFYKDGHVVKGAGKSEKVEPDAPGVQDELKRELDFWLSGKYREAVSP